MSCVPQHVEDIYYALSLMQKTLECPICLDLMKEPVTTRCDHTFCRSCMLQLLSRKKRGGAPCPMCKKKFTKRSLQESPRFNFVIDSLKKIISAFELDSGYRFFPSQDNASDGVIVSEENRRNEEQSVVQSKGYRKRKRNRITNENQCEDHTTLLETNVDTQLIRDAEAENLSRGNCSKQDTNDECKRTLNEPSCSKDDLFRDTNSLGNDHDRSRNEMVEGDDSPESQDENMETCEDASLTLETDEVVITDLAEYGISERDLESTSSSLLCIDNTSALKETTAKKSFIEAHDQNSIYYLTEEAIDSKENDQAGSTTQSNKYSRDENQTSTISDDDQYYKADSVPEEMTSNQSSQISTSVKVPRKRRMISVQKVNEWFKHTSVFFDDVSWNEELLSEVFPELDDDSPDESSCTSGETEIMTKCYTSAMPAEKAVNVRDKIFGRIYKREKKSSAAPHVNDKNKKLTSDLVPESSTKEETTENFNSNDGGNLLNTDKHLSVQDSNCVNIDQSKSQTKLKTKKKSVKKSEIASCSGTAPSLTLVKGSDISMDKHGPCHFSEMEINAYSSSNKSEDEDNQVNVRRSRRLSLPLKKEEPSPKQKPAKARSKVIKKDIDPPCSDSITETNLQRKQMCTTFNESEEKKPTMLAPNGKEAPLVIDVEIHPAQPECETSQLTDVSVKECSNMPAEAVRNVLSAENTDSDCDTQHLIKAFKSTKRMSFRLDPINEIDKKEHFTLINLSETKTNLPNCSQAEIALMVFDKKEQVIHTDDVILSNGKNRIVGEDVMQQKCHIPNLPTRQGKTSKRLENISTSEESTESSAKTEFLPLLSDYEMMFNADRLDILNPFHETEPHKVDNQEPNSDVSERETLVYRGVTAVRENEQEKKGYKPSFHEKPSNQMTSDTGSQGSVHSVSCQNSSLRCHEVYSDTPDGLLGIADRSGEEHSFVAEAEKSFVFAKEPKVTVSDSSESPPNDSPLVKSKKRKAPMLETSDSESSEDEELPCFNTFLGTASNSVDQKNASAVLSPKQQGGGIMDKSSTCSSTSCRSSRVLEFFEKVLPGSQESVNLFSSQSSTPDHPTDVVIDPEFKHSVCHDKNGDKIPSKKQVQEEDKSTSNENDNTSKKENLDKTSGSESESSETSGSDSESSETSGSESESSETSGCESGSSETSGCESGSSDSTTESSQCEVYNTQQRDAMWNNLVRLQEEMAFLESVLEQNNTQSPSSKEAESTPELNTTRLQEGSQKQTQHGENITPAAVPETEMPSLKNVEQPIEPLDVRSESSTLPRQKRSRKQTQEKVLKENTLSPEESKTTELPIECCPSESDTCKPAEASVNQASAFPKKSKRSTPRNIGAINAVSTSERSITLEANKQSLKRKADIGDINRPTSPTFISPKRSRRGSASKTPVVTNKRDFSLVASGLSQSELILVQKFAKKTQSVFSGEISESTTHVIMKTDEHLVCHRTMKYFLGIAGRKWVVSFNWIVQSFREGRILDEYDFEVKGDVVSGRNHRGPRRSRLGTDGLLLSNFDICCVGNFKDMTRENLEWMVSLCGASSVKEPQMFKHKEGITSLVVVQGDGKANYAALRKKYCSRVVSRDWILDSVSSYKLQPFDSYLL